jgi:RNA polymerase sigma-70 factor (ECF subfamily)
MGSERVPGRPTDEKNEVLLRRALDGDEEAFAQLFEKNRRRLQKSIALRMDKRLSSRVGSSDVLQETYMEAARRLPAYAREHTMPLLTWLRWIAREKTMAMYRRHFGAAKRSVGLEVPLLPVDTSAKLAADLLSQEPSPSRKLARTELAGILRRGMEQLRPDERELILLHDFEGVTARDAAQCLNVGEAAAAKRYARARARLRGFLLQKGVSGSD